ncbi:MAG: UDP-N-acetylglucosamine 2-epimerase (non-hydrolyzing) [Actinomycetota bacterium]|nr:UDP-N-acetylglucosamine 2-epimerase (non-hydrolyzing) [Actinomycetota bacterium]
MNKEGLKIINKEHLTESTCVIVGTRPGIIKMSPIIKELSWRQVPSFTLHTGQHYSYEMDKKFFEDLELPKPLYHLPQCKPGSLHGEQTANMLSGIESMLIKAKPRLVLVCGDANTNLAGALAARKLQIEVGHVESGLRSNDWRMPEEHNRVIIDHISEYLFAPTPRARQNLIGDNVKGKIYLTGNTIVDALIQHIEIAERKSEIIKKLALRESDYVLITIHREENVDHLNTLNDIVEALKLVGHELGIPMIFPVHPRTKNRLKIFNLWDRIMNIPGLRLIEPVGYLDFILLIKYASVIVTDSGGVQEESCILNVPCVTIRDNTERQETVQVGSNIIAGTNPEKILDAINISLEKQRNWPNPFGDGRAAERIVDILSGAPFVEWSFISEVRS